ncbi:unnamed protein product, partial [Phaeothamnion confervicola]
STTFREYVLLPRCTRKESDIRTLKLNTRLTHDIELAAPFMSAAMEAVSGDRLAIALAQHGGMAVLPAGNVGIEQQLDYLRAAKRFKAGFVTNVKTVGPNDSIRHLIELDHQFGYSTFPVVEGDGRLVGLITEKKYN